MEDLIRANKAYNVPDPKSKYFLAVEKGDNINTKKTESVPKKGFLLVLHYFFDGGKTTDSNVVKRENTTTLTACFPSMHGTFLLDSISKSRIDTRFELHIYDEAESRKGPGVAGPHTSITVSNLLSYLTHYSGDMFIFSGFFDCMELKSKPKNTSYTRRGTVYISQGLNKK